MNTSTNTVEQSLITISGQLLSAYQEAVDIVKAYFSTGASALVGAQQSGAGVTVSTALTKERFLAGITACQALQNLIGGSDVGQDDYMSSLQNLLHGSTSAVSALSQDVESIGSRMVSLAGTLISLKKQADALLSVYSSAQLSAALIAMSGDPVVFGCNVPKTKMLNGVNMVQQYANMIGAQVVATGDYLSIVQAWIQGL